MNVPYEPVDALRRLVAEPARTVIVTTKEGEFTRLVLDAWQVRVADVQGKEAGTHKCDNLRALIAAQEKSAGRRPRLWFVEDRLETLEHVTTHPDLADVGLFLAAWGYNTEETRARAVAEPARAPAGASAVREGSRGLAEPMSPADRQRREQVARGRSRSH